MSDVAGTTSPDLRHFTTADGARLVYRDSGGTGPALVLLHGGFLDGRMWDDQIPYFARDFRVIVPDARGHGASDIATGPFRQCDDVAELLGELGVDDAAFVGLSMGGAIAVDVALEHPGLVRAVVVTDVGTSEPTFEDPWNKAVLAEQARAMAAGDPVAYVEAFLRFVAGPHRTLAEVDPDVVRRVRTMATETVAKHTADEPDHRILVTDTWKRAAGIAVPVFAVNGGLSSDDHIGMAERLVRTVVNGRSALVEGTAHYPNMERPEQFNTLVREFLDGALTR